MKYTREIYGDIDRIKKVVVKHIKVGGFIKISPITKIFYAKELMEACGVYTRITFSFRLFAIGLRVIEIGREDEEYDAG